MVSCKHVLPRPTISIRARSWSSSSTLSYWPALIAAAGPSPGPRSYPPLDSTSGHLPTMVTLTSPSAICACRQPVGGSETSRPQGTRRRLEAEGKGWTCCALTLLRHSYRQGCPPLESPFPLTSAFLAQLIHLWCQPPSLVRVRLPLDRCLSPSSPCSCSICCVAQFKALVRPHTRVRIPSIPQASASRWHYGPHDDLHTCLP